MKPVVARGPGPMPFRIVLLVLACGYFAVLLHHPAKREVFDDMSGSRKALLRLINVVAHLSECTGLFPNADMVTDKSKQLVPGTREFRVEAWSCARKKWEPLDTRPFFPIQADDKESRLPRLIHYYLEEGSGDEARLVAFALDDWLYACHDPDVDGVAGPIGGFRILNVRHILGTPGDPVERYAYDPLAPVVMDNAKLVYKTTRDPRKDGGAGIKARCKDTVAPDPAAVEDPKPNVVDPWGSP